MNKCKVKDCQNKVYAKRMCSKHYTRYHRYGDYNIVHPKGGEIHDKTKRMIALHESGYSSREIANILFMKKNSVVVLLRHHKNLRRSPGLDIEDKIGEFMLAKNNKVEHMRGDWYYDFLINGKKTDVKSSKLHKNNAYTFQMQSLNKTGKLKNLHKVDQYILVMTDDMSIYLLKSTDIKNPYLQNLSLRSHRLDKYPIEFLGCLS